MYNIAFYDKFDRIHNFSVDTMQTLLHLLNFAVRHGWEIIPN